VSLSAESNMTIVNEEDTFEDDFEVIPEEEDELRLSSWPEVEGFYFFIYVLIKLIECSHLQ